MFAMAGLISRRSKPRPEQPEFATDEQTGVVWELRREHRTDRCMARLSFVYLAAVLGLMFLFLLDVWSSRDWALGSLGFSSRQLNSPTFRLLAYVATGGAMGATLDGIRSNISWHSERAAYGGRFIWRDLSLPLCGAGVGLMTYVALRGGAGAVSGDFSIDGAGKAPAMVGFGVATLAGFSYHQVFRWLDAQASRIFSVSRDVIVPDLVGKTAVEARKALAQWKLTFGKATEDPTAAAASGTVVGQTPRAGAPATQGDVVDVVLGSRSSPEATADGDRSKADRIETALA